jgi:arabinose-5-phosphate isomerase
MLALGDALALAVAECRGFSPEDFARFHPAGTLGRRLARVDTVMRTGAELRYARETETVREVFARKTAGRRTGAVMVLAENGELAGVFTDSDLAKLFEARHDTALDSPIGYVMTRQPITTVPTARVGDVIELLRARKISEIPVLNTERIPVGLLDITDLIGFETTATTARPTLKLLARETA